MSSGKVLIVDPIRSGGIVPEGVKKNLIEYLDGYSTCLYCTGDLHSIKRPNIKKLVEELEAFIDCSKVRLVHGAREGMFTVMFALYKEYVLRNEKAPVVVADGNAHYTSLLAAERSMLEVVLTKTTDYPEFKVVPEDFEEKIALVKKNYGKPPLLALITYPDGNYGNIPEVKKIVDICKSHGIHVLINAAYAIGRIPFSLNKIGADFAVGSGHKSMACTGPIGVLAMAEEASQIILKKSKYKENKEVELLGCTVRGTPVICLLQVLPYLKKRVSEWQSKVEIARYVADHLEKELGFKLLGEKPHSHDLLYFETHRLYEISLKVRDRFFLYKELKKRNIIGIKPGITKRMKISTYLLEKETADYFIDCLREIVERFENYDFTNK